jgi:protein-tyrosine phosphatase
VNRAVTWDGLHNTRDLGGLPLRANRGGAVTSYGHIYRSGRLDDLDAEGWKHLVGRGVATLIDLRNGSEVREAPLRPTSLRVSSRPVEDELDEAFMAQWRGRLGNPGYYQAAVERWPQLFQATFEAIADAHDGGIVIHCSAGRDRTGLVVSLLLDAAGVEREAILDDYEWSVRATNDRLTTHPLPHETAVDTVTLSARIVEARGALTTFLDDVDRRPFASALSVAAARLTRRSAARSTASECYFLGASCSMIA